MSWRLRSLGLSLFFFSASFLFFSCAPPSKLVYFEGQTMGTVYRVNISSAEKIDADALKEKVDAYLEDFNQIFSTYIDGSEISTINRAASKSNVSWLPSKAFALEWKKSLAVSEETHGAFDVTVAPLIDLWHFDKEQKKIKVIPSEEEIADAKRFVGYKNVFLDEKNVLNIPKGFRLNFSAIAKGTAVDGVADILEALGFEHYLVEIGGEVVMRGKNHKNQLWKLRVISPSSQAQVDDVVLTSKEDGSRVAVATSGDYANYYVVDGVAYSHTIDPFTGRPVRHNLASATVVEQSCAKADALATALMVMGEEKGFAFAKDHQLAAYFIYRDKGDFLQRMTDYFSPFLLKE